MEIINFAKDNNKAPEFNQNRNEEFYSYGSDNAMPEYLDAMLDMSPVHSSLVHSIANYIVGEGFLDKESSIFLNENGEENLDEILRSICFDIKNKGGFALNVQLPLGGRKKGQPTVNYVDFNKVRVCVPGVGKKKGVQYYQTSPDWKKYKKEGFEPVTWEAYTKNTTTPSTLLYVKCDGKKTNPYPVPVWYSARKYIEIQNEVVNFHLKNLQNGATPRMVLLFTGPEPEQAEKDQMKKNWSKFLGSTDNTGKAAVIYNSAGMEIKPLSLDLSDERFLQLDTQTTIRIKVAHQVAGKILFGITGSEGGTNFASTRDAANEFILFQNTIIRPYQRQIEDSFSSIYGERVEIVPFKLFEEVLPDTDLDNLLPAELPEGTEVAPIINEITKTNE